MGNHEVLARRFAEANLRVEVIEREIQRVSRWSSDAKRLLLLPVVNFRGLWRCALSELVNFLFAKTCRMTL